MPVSFLPILFSLLYFSLITVVEAHEAVLINSIEEGRLGVQINRFARAYSLSKKYGIPFKYVDANKRKYFKELSLEYYFEEFSPEDCSQFENIIHMNHEEELSSFSTVDSPTLYICYNHTHFNYKKFLKKHPEYKKELQEVLRPKVAVFPMFIPDMFNVAVHYRTGRSYDGPFLQDQFEREPGVVYVDEKYPMRFLPLEYFFEQLEWVFQRLNHHPLYVRIFTDDPDIPGVEEAFKSRFANYPIQFAENAEMDYKHSTITEWWTMSFFDCLIRPESHYSKVSELFGDHKIIIYPTESHFEGTKLIIDKVKRKESGLEHIPS